MMAMRMWRRMLVATRVTMTVPQPLPRSLLAASATSATPAITCTAPTPTRHLGLRLVDTEDVRGAQELRRQLRPRRRRVQQGGHPGGPGVGCEGGWMVGWRAR